MKANSIRSNLTKDSAISEIKLSLGADIEKKKVHVVVEGQDDIKVLRKFCETNTVIIESYSGKQGVEEIVCSKVINDHRVVGIRDKDYCNSTVGSRVFFYDKCCLEMMMLSFNETFESIYHEYYCGILNPEQLKKTIFEELYKVSQVRKYNEEKKAGIKFTGLKYNKLVNKKGELEIATFINELEKTNPEVDFSDVKETLKNKAKNDADYFDVTNGHDFLSFFKVLCDKSRKKPIKKDEIPSSLRTSFNETHFKKTELYRYINEYCGDNALSLWKS
jgi:hypothetical protein